MADTDILLGVDLDITNADKTAEQLQKEVESIFNSRSGKQSAALTQLELQMKQTYDKAQALREELQRIGDTPVATEEYTKLEAAMSKYESRYYELMEKMSQFEDAGGDINSSKYQQWAVEFERISDATGNISVQMEQMKKNGTAFISGSETDKYKKTVSELDKANDKLKQQIIRYEEIANKSIPKTNQQVQKLAVATEKVRKSSNDISTNFSKGLKGTTRNITRLISKFALLFLGVRGLWSLVMKVRSAITEGFKNLRESGVGRLKQQMQDLTNASTTLKNALAGAFEPIVTSIIPYIQRLVEWLTIAIDKLAQFIAAMKGQTTYIKAIKQVGNAGEKASKQLAKFDELNILNSPKGNGAAGMFEEAKIADEMIDRVAELKRKIKEVYDWLNTYIFTPIKSFLAWLLRPITDNIEKIKLAIRNFWTFISPILDWIREKFQHTFGVLKDVYEQYIKPSLDKVMDYISTFFGILLDFWNDHQEDFAWIRDEILTIWDESVQPVIDEALLLLGDLFALVIDFITGGDLENFKAGLYAFWDWLFPKIQSVLEGIRLIGKTISAYVVKTLQNARAGADVIRQLLEKTGSRWTTFKILVALAIDAIREKFNQILDDIFTISHYGQEEFGILIYLFQSPLLVAINLVKSAFESLKEKVEAVFNVIKAFLGIDVSGSPILQLLDKANSINLNSLTTGVAGKGIPIGGKMASGGVIPPNASEHLVMVGDNNKETEVVSPLSTMQDAMINALQAVGIGGEGQPINIYLGTDKIYSEIRKLEKRNLVMGG